jgi:hypothetical protein
MGVVCPLGGKVLAIHLKTTELFLFIDCEYYD